MSPASIRYKLNVYYNTIPMLIRNSRCKQPAAVWQHPPPLLPYKPMRMTYHRVSIRYISRCMRSLESEREGDRTRLATSWWSMLWRQFHVVLYPILTPREGYDMLVQKGLSILQIVWLYILMHLLKFNLFLNLHNKSKIVDYFVYFCLYNYDLGNNRSLVNTLTI